MKAFDQTRKKFVYAMECVNDFRKNCEFSIEKAQRRVSAQGPIQWPSEMLKKRRSASFGQRMHVLSRDGVFVEAATSVSAFEMQTVLGRGTFGSVYVARHKKSGMYTALKIIQREKVEAMRQEINVFREQIVHLCLEHPFICKLLGTFQDSNAIYFVLEYCSGGELYSLLYDEAIEDDVRTDRESSTDDSTSIHSEKSTDEEEFELEEMKMNWALPQTPQMFSSPTIDGLCQLDDINKKAKKSLKSLYFRGLQEQHVAFYMACLLSALEYIHKSNIMYRDIKLENIVLGADGYPRLVDFGLSKPDAMQSKSTTICGSMEYMAPELIERKAYDKSVDFWAFGILMYELLFGVTPFYHPNHREQGRRIIEDCLTFPDNFQEQCPEAVDLIRTLLNKSSLERLSSWDKVRESSFFKKHFPQKYAWKNLFNKTIQAPFIPQLKSVSDSSLFVKASYSEDYDVY